MFLQWERGNINEKIGYKYTLRGNTEMVGMVNIKIFNFCYLMCLFDATTLPISLSFPTLVFIAVVFKYTTL